MSVLVRRRYELREMTYDARGLWAVDEVSPSGEKRVMTCGHTYVEAQHLASLYDSIVDAFIEDNQLEEVVEELHEIERNISRVLQNLDLVDEAMDSIKRGLDKST